MEPWRGRSFPSTPQVTLSGLDTARVLSDLLLLSVPEKTELLPHFLGEETKGQGSEVTLCGFTQSELCS